MKPKNKKSFLILISIIAVYFIVCAALFFFEPVFYNAPNLSEFQYCFDSYKKYDIYNDDGFYIKQITADDVIIAENDSRIKYIENTAIAIADSKYGYSDISAILKNYNASICGYIDCVDLYQIEFAGNLSFQDLLNLCNSLQQSNVFIDAIPDYFEETPVNEYSTELYNPNTYYYDILGLFEAREIFGDMQSVNIGIIDFYTDNKSEYLNLINGADYSVDDAYGNIYSASTASHGTHVAGIIGASDSSDTPGVMDNAKIYSYNGINVSTSYWIANICDMIINNDVKVINVSMAYNSYITTSAALGCENAIRHIECENDFFSTLLSNLLESGHEFVICAAAGNSAKSSAYKSFGTYFSYGDKKILDAIDIFGIFDSKPDYVDAKYAFLFSNIKNEDVSDRIIIVGSINDNYEYSDFSNSGKVDIAAPGEHIYSITLNNSYTYMSGTSMATPFVTGTAAMIFSLNPDMTGAEVKNVILESAKHSVSAGEFTYPILNIYESVKKSVARN